MILHIYYVNIIHARYNIFFFYDKKFRSTHGTSTSVLIIWHDCEFKKDSWSGRGPRK